MGNITCIQGDEGCGKIANKKNIVWCTYKNISLTVIFNQGQQIVPNDFTLFFI